MTRRLAVKLGLPVAAALFASLGCGDPRPVVNSNNAVSASTGCADCHGDRTPGVLPGDPRSAPGFDGGTDVSGRVAGDPVATSIGAHARHLTGGTKGGKVACDECHAVPATVLAPGHLDGVVTVAFGPLATKFGSSPIYDPATQTCTNVACHGIPGARVNPVVWPSWQQGAAATVCGSCHDLPPPFPIHINIDKARQGCNTPINPNFQCHPAAYTPTSVDLTLHMDGRVCPPDCTPITQ